MSVTRPHAPAVVAAVAVALSMAGCAGPAPSARIVRGAPAHPVVTTAAPPPPAAPSPVPLGRGASVRRSWADASLTARFCGVAGAVRFRQGRLRTASTTYSQVDLTVGRPLYGRFGPLGEVAAVSVDCNNTGGTAAGNLGSAYVVVDRRGDRLLAIGEITPQADLGERASYVSRVAFSDGTILATEHWYRSEDATCCPSGETVTVWSYRDGALVAGPPHVTR